MCLMIGLRTYFNSHASCEAWPLKKLMIWFSMKISTHTPHARRDRNLYRRVDTELWFQLTRLMRGVTHLLIICLSMVLHFNSHASCEAWPRSGAEARPHHENFNSHASCEAWPTLSEKRKPLSAFQLTRLMRGVTFFQFHDIITSWISTHTPHARRDSVLWSSDL